MGRRARQTGWAWALSTTLGACGADAAAPGPSPSDTAGPPPSFELVGTPTLSLPEGTRAFGVHQLTVATTAPTTATVRIDDLCGRRDVHFPAQATEHVLDVRGLHLGEPSEVSVLLTDADGGQRTVPVTTVTPVVPEGLPTIEVLTHEPTAMAPGLLVVAPQSQAGTEWVLVLDEALHLVHALPLAFEDLRLHDGQWLGLHDDLALRLDLYGRELASLGKPAWGLNHELFPLPDGDMLVLDRAVEEVSDYPVDAEATETGPATVISQGVVRISPEGELGERFTLFDVLPTSVVGYKSVEALETEAKDWTHANAVVPYGDDAYLVSVRHLDVVAAVSRDGELRWLLGDPTGWPSPYVERFLTPVGELTWPRHQHALELQPDGQTVVMFDNRTFAGSPRAPAPDDAETVSRGVAFRVDEAAGTVEQLWEVEHEGLFTYAMGDADVLGSTGLVQLVFSRVAQPQLHTRLVQRPIDGGPAVLDLAIGRDVPRWTYRATVVPTLYGPEVTVEHTRR